MHETNSEKINKAIADSEMGGSGVGHSNVASDGAHEAPSGANLDYETTIQRLEKRIQELESKKSVSDINTFAQAFAEALANNTPKGSAVGPSASEGINKTQDFSQRNMVDGRSLMEAQEAVRMFRNEPTVPIYVPKSFATFCGPTMAVSVNGVRVAIPCDGKTYAINATHAEAIKERMAKLDAAMTPKEPDVVEITA